MFCRDAKTFFKKTSVSLVNTYQPLDVTNVYKINGVKKS